MNLKDLEVKFTELGDNYKTIDVDRLNKRLIKEKVNVEFLKDMVLTNPRYHRTYFQVSLGQIKNIEDQLSFIEDNFYNLEDWWHVDQLTQFISKTLTFDLAYERALVYSVHSHPFARRWAYVIFIPTLVKDKDNFKKLFELFKDDDEYYVIMAEAWLISYLGIYFPKETMDYLKKKPLKYNIVGRAIQKICDSYRISNEYKEEFKKIRSLYR